MASLQQPARILSSGLRGIVASMELVALIAPEVDRLVLAANARVMQEHGERILEVGRPHGLDRLDLIGQLAPFMAAGSLTRDLGATRMRYFPTERVIARIDELERAGLLEARNDSLLAGPGLAAVLDTAADALRQVTTGLWHQEPEAVEQASSIADRLSAAATPDHVVAAVHREVPEPAEPGPRLHQRLVTLRFVRQHDHAEAWSALGLTPAEMVVLTDLWHGKGVGSSIVMDGLVSRGYVDTDPMRLTDEGRSIRRRIEAETNRRNAETFSILSAVETEAFLAALRKLPGSV